MESQRPEPGIITKAVVLAFTGLMAVLFAGPILMGFLVFTVGFGGWLGVRALAGKPVSWRYVRDSIKGISRTAYDAWRAAIYAVSGTAAFAKRRVPIERVRVVGADLGRKVADGGRQAYGQVRKAGGLAREKARLVRAVFIETFCGAVIGGILAMFAASQTALGEQTLGIAGAVAGATLGALLGVVSQPSTAKSTEAAGALASHHPNG